MHLRKAANIQLFQQRRVAQCFKQICGSICSFRESVEAPAVFCQKQSVKNTLGWGQSEGIHSVLNHSNPSRSTSSLRPKKAGIRSTIFLCEAPIEICLLQVEPLGTMNSLPRWWWDPITVGKIQLFQQGRLAQCFKQICGAICCLRVTAEAPARFCQNHSVDRMLGRRQVQFILNPSRLIPTHTTTSQIYKLYTQSYWIRRTSNRDKLNTDIKNKKTLCPQPLRTFNHFSLQGTQRNLPSSNWATWHHEVFARPLLGSENSHWNPTLPAGTTGSRLQANLWLHLLLSCLCRSTCSVLSESICRKHLETAISAGIQSILNPSRSLRVNSDSYDNFTNLYNSELEQLPTETNRYT